MPIVPMFHVNAWGLPYCAPMLGSKLVLCGPAHDAASLYELIEREDVTTAGAVPAVWLRLLAYLEEQGRELTALRALRVGGSAAPASMIEAYERRGIEVIHGWGMTETSPVCTTGSLKPAHRDSPERLTYQLKAGRCLFGVEMKIVDDSGRRLPEDGVAQGELCVRGPWVASAYYEDPAATAAAFTADGWFRTGDLGVIDADGYLRITGRLKEIIIRKGEKISVKEVEDLIATHPAVAEVALIPLPDPDTGERACAVVRFRPGMTVDLIALTAFLSTKSLAKQKWPEQLEAVDDFPRTDSGKIQREKLKQRFTRATER
jgi:fatty-acyl-CoA synthase